MTVVYKVAHQNKGGQPVFGPENTTKTAGIVSIPIALQGYDLVGIVPVSVDGHILPASVNQFDKKDQCSAATSKTFTTGSLTFSLEGKKLSCSSSGTVE